GAIPETACSSRPCSSTAPPPIEDRWFVSADRPLVGQKPTRARAIGSPVGWFCSGCPARIPDAAATVRALSAPALRDLLLVPQTAGARRVLSQSRLWRG